MNLCDSRSINSSVPFGLYLLKLAVSVGDNESGLGVGCLDDERMVNYYRFLRPE